MIVNTAMPAMASLCLRSLRHTSIHWLTGFWVVVGSSCNTSALAAMVHS